MDWAGYPSLEVTVACAGTPHAVTWRAGELTIVDHDDDGEDVLTALGAAPPACATLVDAWRRVNAPAATLTILKLLRETADADGPARSARLQEQLDRARPGPPAMTSFEKPNDYLAWARAQAQYEAHLERVAQALPTEWLAVSVAGHLADLSAWSRVPADDRELVRQWVQRLAVEAFEASEARPRAIGFRVNEWCVPDVVGGEVVVPPAWVSRVRARQAGVIDGRFVLDLVPHASGDRRFVARMLDIAPHGRLRVVPSIVQLEDTGWVPA
jgi:hypothetical protein